MSELAAAILWICDFTPACPQLTTMDCSPTPSIPKGIWWWPRDCTEKRSLGAYGVHSWEHARLGPGLHGGFPALLEQELPERNRPAAGAGLQGPNPEAALVPDERHGR